MGISRRDGQVFLFVHQFWCLVVVVLFGWFLSFMEWTFLHIAASSAASHILIASAFSLDFYKKED